MVAGDLKAEWFFSINPTGKVPALVHVKEDSTSVTVFESVACLLYMADTFDRDNKISLPFGTTDYYTQLSWVAGYGRMMGQATHFNRYVPDAVPYGSWRYTAECKRLHCVLDKQLSTVPYVTGDCLNIVDNAIFIYAHSANWCGIVPEDFPYVKAWHDKLAQRRAFQKALQILMPYMISDQFVNDQDAVEFHRSMRTLGTQAIRGDTERWKSEVVPVPSDHANLTGIDWIGG